MRGHEGLDVRFGQRWREKNLKDRGYRALSEESGGMGNIKKPLTGIEGRSGDNLSGRLRNGEQRKKFLGREEGKLY